MTLFVKTALEAGDIVDILNANGYKAEMSQMPLNIPDEMRYKIDIVDTLKHDESEHFKCDAYHTEERHVSLDFGVLGTGSRTKLVGVCWGTKEREECYCHGDKRKCNFYKLNEEGRLL